VTKDDVQTACKLLGDGTVEIVTVEPKTMSDVLGDVATVAKACGVPERGARLVRHMEARLDVVRAAVEEVKGVCGLERPKVAHLEWIAPLMGSGYWIAECVEAGGGDMICGKIGGNSAVLDGPERLLEADIIILAPCGFSIERTKVELDAVSFLADPVVAGLPAVKSGKCFVADGNRYFNRSSCGVVETAEMVAEMISPELLGLWGHHGERFVNLRELDKFCARSGAPAPDKPVPGPDPSHGFQAPPEQFKGGNAQNEKQCISGPERLTMGPEDVVKAQLAALKVSDFDAAFELNSEKNKVRLSSAAKFGTIVRGTSFNVLLDSNAVVTTAEPVKGDQLGAQADSAAIRVDAVVPGSPSNRFYFDVGRDGPGAAWATEGVRIGC